jgi:hypothetical protein
MARENLGDFEHQVLLTVLRLGGEAYSVPVVEELEERRAATSGKEGPVDVAVRRSGR